MAQTHLVTDPCSYDQHPSEICGFLMLNLHGNFSRPTSTSATWHRRWFVLQRPYLYCYKSYARKYQVGIMDISKSQVIVQPGDANLPFSFHLLSLYDKSFRVWHFQASTAAEMRAWLVAIDPLKIEARESLVAQTLERMAPTA
jgi:hypothetical protein